MRRASALVLAARSGVWCSAGSVELRLGVEHWAGAGQNVQGDCNFPGFRRAYAHDPFGNRLEFLSTARWLFPERNS